MSHRPGRATLFGALICVTVIGWQGVPVARLLGFGRGTLYLVRIDDDDLQYLQRFRLP